MKKLQFFIFICLLSISSTWGQSDLLNSPRVIFFGLDFREARLVGSSGFTNPYHIKSEYFDAWNYLMANEKDKYNIKKYFGKQSVEYALSAVQKANQTVDPEKMVINDPYQLNTEKIPGLIQSLDIDPSLKGLGLIFIIEYFNKFQERASYYAVFFDIEKKQVVSVSRRSGKPGGFGLRNYWAGAILDAMEKGPVK
ncbi:MAG: hypothetical protein N2050_08375 [Flavobacteriales bacterium]|nr:hypothetical protein [Flavobacteriales bacterium]